MPFAGPRRVLLSVPTRDLLRDDFNGAAISGLWTVVDTTADLSVSGGALISGGGAAGGAGDPRIVSARSFARKAGRTIDLDFSAAANSASGWAGFSNSATPTNAQGEGFYIAGGPQIAGTGLTTAFTAAVSGIGRQMRVVLRATGAAYYLRGQGMSAPYDTLTGPWALVWVDSTQTTDPVWPGVWELGNLGTVTYTLRQIRVYDRAAPSPVVSVASPSGSPSDISIADGIIECGVASVTAGNPAGVQFRGDGTINNRWLAYLDGTNLKVDSVSGGVVTNQASAADASASGTIRVVLVGTSIQVYVGSTRRANITNATFQTATQHGGYQSGTSTLNTLAVWAGLSS